VFLVERDGEMLAVKVAVYQEILEKEISIVKELKAFAELRSRALDS
jgi:hypothetical protein